MSAGRTPGRLCCRVCAPIAWSTASSGFKGLHQGARRHRSRSPWATLRATPPGVCVTLPGTDPPRCSAAPASGRACGTGPQRSPRSVLCGSGTRRCSNDHRRCRARPSVHTSQGDHGREAGAQCLLSRCDRTRTMQHFATHHDAAGSLARLCAYWPASLMRMRHCSSKAVAARAATWYRRACTGRW